MINLRRVLMSSALVLGAAGAARAAALRAAVVTGTVEVRGAGGVQRILSGPTPPPLRAGDRVSVVSGRAEFASPRASVVAEEGAEFQLGEAKGGPVIQVLRGSARVAAGGRTVQLPAGAAVAVSRGGALTVVAGVGAAVDPDGTSTPVPAGEAVKAPQPAPRVFKSILLPQPG